MQTLAQPGLDNATLAKTLNEAQYSAVTQFPGPQLILAGAGSGKTRVLTYKIAWLVREKGFRPSSILGATFTNKAAKEMQERIGNLLGGQINFPWVGTFHSICGRLLRYHGHALGFTSNFTIYDTDDQKRFVKKLLKAHSSRFDEKSGDKYRWAISSWKNRGMDPEDAMQESASQHEESIIEFFKLYQQELKNNNAMDFDDLIWHAIHLFKKEPSIRESVSRSFEYVLIDEYQDTNRAQYLLLQHLVNPAQNVVAVGDDDQSIYSWRGADINNILSFRKDFPNAAIHKLEQNYRSSKNILKTAESVICNNQQRMEKNLWTDNDEGEKVKVLAFPEDMEEAATVARKVADTAEFGLKDTAIFYRTNAQSRVIEDQLRRHRVNYVVVGGMRFYDRKEIKDLVAYLRVLTNASDSVSLGRIINVPKRAIGDKTVERYVDEALRRGITLYEALALPDAEGVNNGTRDKVTRFHGLMESMRAEITQKSVPEMIEFVIDKSGYRDALQAEATDEAYDRMENLDELVTAADEFSQREENTSLETFLQDVSLQTDADENKGKGREAVTLMTVHAAKGLEFPRVFVTGLEDGLFPLQRFSDDVDVEEERRLFYVAATRAMQRLTLSYCTFRRRFGAGEIAMPSRFFEELDQSCLEKSGNASHTNWEEASGGGYNSQHSRKKKPSSGESFPDYEMESQESEPWFVGQAVSHGKFGPGRITKTEGRGDDARVEVLFQDGNRRKLMLKYARLQSLEI